MPSKNSTNKRKDSKETSPDLLNKKLDYKTQLTTWTNVSVPKPLSSKPPKTSSPETTNFGIKLKLFVPLSITNTTMPPNPEDKNYNSSLN
jgi:hypothetical protein